MADFQGAHSVVERLKSVDADLFLFEVCDFFGRAHTVCVPRSKLEEAVEDGLELPVRAVFKESSNDKNDNLDKICSIRADPTADILRHPFHRSMAYVPAEPFVDGSPLTSYPRFVARKQLSRLAELGFSLKSSFHLEFFLKSKKEGIQYIGRETLIGHFFDALERTGKKFKIENFHVGTMANRIDGTFKEVLGIKSADYAQYFKTFVKEAADTFLHEASVLEKANLSLYFRHSLWDIKGKKCLTGDPDSPLGLSVAAQHWMAGILEHMPAIVRFTHPTQFSWDQVEHEQPNCRWGTDSAGSSVRLHRGEEGKTFVETRQGTGRCNPYLLTAAVVAAGIDGMEKKLPLSEAGTDNKKMPTTIAEATEAFEADEVLLAAFDGGKDFLPLLKTSLTFL